MCKVLASIARDPKAPYSERRRCAMDLIAVGSGLPALVQEVAGRDGLAPLVALNFGTSPLDPEAAYSMMVAGTIPIDPEHVAFARSVVGVPAQEGVSAGNTTTVDTANASKIEPSSATTEAQT